MRGTLGFKDSKRTTFSILDCCREPGADWESQRTMRMRIHAPTDWWGDRTIPGFSAPRRTPLTSARPMTVAASLYAWECLTTVPASTDINTQTDCPAG